jgi:CubicO group peptidase (beta-lactamase class C family)
VAEYVSEADQFLSDLTEMRLFSGAVLVARNREVLFSKGYGFADREREIPNTPQTKFRLVALNSQFNAMGILILQAQEKLDAEDSICKYLPDCAPAWEPITIHHLLCRAAGLAIYLNDPGFAEGLEESLATHMPPEDVNALIKDEPLRYQPGEERDFMSGGSEQFLLAQIIENVSGIPYHEFLEQHIFAPLGMQDTGPVDAEVVLALEYRAGSSRRLPAADTSVLRGVTSVYSTLEDLLRWDEALYTEELVPQALLNQMFADHGEFAKHPFDLTTIGFGYSEDYGRTGAGYAWAMGEQFGHRDFMSWGASLTPRLMMEEEGRWLGFSDYIDRFPDDRVTIIVLTNLLEADAIPVGAKLAKLLFKPR